MQFGVANFEELKIFCSLLTLCLLNAVQAQEMFFATNPRMTPSYNYSRVIGENAGGIYVLKYRDPEIRRHFTLERYSHSLEFADEQDYSLDKRDKLLKVFTRDSGMAFVIARKLKTQIEIIVYSLGYNIKEEPVERSIGTIQLAESLEDIRCEYSLNRNWCGVWVEIHSRENRQELAVLRYDLQRQEVKQSIVKMTEDWRSTRIDEAAIANNGEAVCAAMNEDNLRRHADPSFQKYYVYFSGNGDKARILPLNEGKYFVTGLDIVRDEFSSRFVISGFYDYKNPGAAHGFFTMKVESDTQILQFQAFDRKWVAGLIGAKEAEKGLEPENYFIRKMVPRSDGGVLIIAENYYITQQLETFYLNGVPQTSSKNVYNYNDLIFLAVDSSGNNEWNYIHRKRQSSFSNGSYYHSIGVYVCDSSINVIYNENASQSNRVMHLKLDREGNLEQRILFNSDNVYTAIVPFEGKQTGYNRYVVPLLQEKQTLLLKLVQKN